LVQNFIGGSLAGYRTNRFKSIPEVDREQFQAALIEPCHEPAQNVSGILQGIAMP